MDEEFYLGGLAIGCIAAIVLGLAAAVAGGRASRQMQEVL